METTRASNTKSQNVEDPERGLTRRGIATRNKLMDGARKAFAERGYEATRVADIIEAANTSSGIFYRYFRDKDAILIAILRPLYAELRAVSGRERNSLPITDVAALTHRNQIHLTFYREHRALFRVSREAAASSQSLTFKQMWFDMRSEFMARNAAWLRSLSRQGRMDIDIDLELMAEALGGMNEQMVYTRIALVDEAPGDDEIEAMARVLATIWWRTIFGMEADE